MGMCPDGNCPECQAARAKYAEHFKRNAVVRQRNQAKERQKFLARFDIKFLTERPGFLWANEKVQ